jgi:hypothetical protein
LSTLSHSTAQLTLSPFRLGVKKKESLKNSLFYEDQNRMKNTDIVLKWNTLRNRESLIPVNFHINSIHAFLAPDHLIGNFVVFLNGFDKTVNMHENILLGGRIPDETETF